jgi:23S rRNA (uridine2552-2'-O)-methyltransferase
MADEEKRRWKGPGAISGDAEGGRGGERQHVRADRPSSRKWIERQLLDPYVRKAKAHGYRSRSAYKLIELNTRFHMIKRGARVCDLGAAPGGWAQVALEKGARAVAGIDLLPVEPLVGATFIEGDVRDDAAAQAVLAALGARPDVVLSDMAANTTGHKPTDQIQTGVLAEIAAEFALAHLAPGGAFVTKAFQGGLEPALLARLKKGFESVRHAKPPASRTESPEVYLVALGFRGESDHPEADG